MMQKKEYNIVKAIAMLLVVFGHAQIFTFGNVTWDFPINSFREQLERIISFIYCFHVPLFFFVSGALFRTTEEKQMACSLMLFVKKKAKRLLLPYLGAFVFLLVPVRCLVGYYTPSLWADINKIILDLSTFGNNGHLWFLPTLFIVNVLFYVIEKVNIKHKNIGILSSVIALYLIAFKIPDRYDISIRYLLWFTGGYYFDMLCYARMRQWKPKTYRMFSVICLIIAILGFYMEKKLSFIVAIPLSILVTMLGICSILSMAFSHIGKDGTLFQVFEKNSYSIYILHDEVNYLFLFMISKIICISALTTGQYACVILLKVFVSLLLSVVVIQCAEHIKNNALIILRKFKQGKLL